MIQLPSEIIREISSNLNLKDTFKLACVDKFINESCHEENNRKILNIYYRRSGYAKFCCCVCDGGGVCCVCDKFGENGNIYKFSEIFSRRIRKWENGVPKYHGRVYSYMDKNHILKSDIRRHIRKYLSVRDKQTLCCVDEFLNDTYQYDIYSYKIPIIPY